LLIFFADSVILISDAATTVDREEECWTQGSFWFLLVLSGSFLLFLVLLVLIGSYRFLLVLTSNAATRVDKEGEC